MGKQKWKVRNGKVRIGAFPVTGEAILEDLNKMKIN